MLKPTVFLGGSVKPDWRTPIIRAFPDISFIDPVKDNYDPAVDIYSEVENMLTSDYVVFFEGGEQTELEKELLSHLGVPYKEYDGKVDDNGEDGLDHLMTFLREVDAGNQGDIETLDSGIVVKVEGIPFQLVHDTKIQGHEDNMPLIEEALNDLNESAPVPNLMEAIKSGLTCEGADEHKYGAIMVPVPKEIRDLILKDLTTQIPFEDLATDEKGTMFGVEPDSHITILYGLTDLDESKAALKKFFTKPLIMKTTGAIKYFDNDNSVAWLEIESEDLEKLHTDLSYLSEVPDDKKKKEFIPHCTIAYLKSGARLPVDKVEPFTWEVSKLILSLKDDTRIEVGISGNEIEELVKVVKSSLN